MVRRSALRYVAFAGLVALLASMACIYHASIAGATIYVHQYMTVLRIRNWFGGIVGVVRVGQIVVINTSEHRILHAESGNIGCGSTAFGWSCVIGTPYWDIGTAAYDSYAIVKVWERVSTILWSEEGDLWNKVYYYGGTKVYEFGNFVGVWGGSCKDLSGEITSAVGIALNLIEILLD